MDLPKLLEQWGLILFIVFCIIVFIQLFYYLFFFARLSFFRQKPRVISQTHPVSVIICARDEAGNLTKNLPGALLQKYSTTHEVIVVNDNSYDESKYVLEELKKEFKQLQVIELTQEAKMIPGKKFPLSIGIKSAKYEILLLTDADCVPATEHWIQSMQEKYDEHTEIVLGYGAYNKLPGLLNKLIRWETFMTALQFMSYALAGLPYMGVGRNLSYKRGVFIRQKGFSAHHHIPGGDDDLFINAVANKKNTKINTDPDSFTLSNPAKNWKQWRNQKQRHYTTSKYYKFSGKFLLGLFTLSQFLIYPMLLIALLFYNWQLVLPVFCLRLIIQGVVYYKTLNKLGEKDLFKYFLFLDVWMLFYYLIFAPSLFKKPKPTWK